MASRLCRYFVEGKRATNLCSAGMQKKLGSQITSLLDVVSRDDGLSSYTCMKCKHRIVSLEKSVADLKAFKQLVRSLVQDLACNPS